MTTAHDEHQIPGKHFMAPRGHVAFMADEAGASFVEQVLIGALAVAVIGLVVLAMRR